MSGRIRHGLIALIAGLWAACATSAVAIETTYGEDPVPNSKCYDGFINLGYGIDPIPAKSPYVRWQEWRAARGRPATIGPFKRQVGESRFLPEPTQTEAAPAATMSAPRPQSARQAPLPGTSSRNARTRNLPQGSRVR